MLPDRLPDQRMITLIKSDRRAWRAALLALFATALTALATAQPLPNEVPALVSKRYPTGSIRSISDADAALAEAAKERAEIEARYLVEEQACHPKFFTTSCIEQAKDRRRISVSALRPVEIEANAFKRQARVRERDKALAERLEGDERERQERISNLPTRQPDPVAGGVEAPPRQVQPTLFSNRSEQHEAKVKRTRTDEAAGAEKRAEKIVAYEKKKQDALARQQKVAQRKAEKAQKRKAKQGEDSKPD